jgi:hypothetical protein
VATLTANQDKDNISHKKLQILQWRMSVDYADTLETWEAIENGKIVYSPEFLGANLGGIEKSKYDPARFFDAHTGVLGFFCVSELGGGRVFGELVIDKVDYVKILLVHDRFKIDQKITFFEEKAFKQVFACEFRKRIPYYFTKIKKKWGDHVYVEGE